MSLAVNPSTAPSTVTTAAPSTATAAAPATAPANITSKVDAQATKIPAIKYKVLLGVINDQALFEEIHIPSIDACCQNHYGIINAFFRTQPIKMYGNVSIPIELDPEVVQKIKEVAIAHRQFFETKEKLNSHKNTLFP